MADFRQLEFFVLRYVPDAVKAEFANIGVVMLEPGRNGSGFTDVRFTSDWRRVRCLDGDADVEMLEALERDLRVQLRQVADRELLLKRIQESFSNLVQLSPTSGLLAEDPANEMKILSRMYLEAPAPGGVREARVMGSARQKIWNTMRRSFEDEGVWELMLKGIAVAPFTGAGDPLKIDFGYRVGGEIKLFHAVSLKKNVEQALGLAYRYPKIAEGILEKESAAASLTAVVDDDYDRGLPQVGFALEELKKYQVGVAAAGEMGLIARRARAELVE